MVNDNPSLGYTRVQGAVRNVGFKVGRGTIANVLLTHGIDPAPMRGKRTAWSTFLKAHWEILATSGFFTFAVGRLGDLLNHYERLAA